VSKSLEDYGELVRGSSSQPLQMPGDVATLVRRRPQVRGIARQTSTSRCNDEHPAHFMFYENWESRELWKTQMNNQHLKDYVAATDGAVEVFTLHEMTYLA